MDALALLCNLHADGPATLRLLRRSGLRSLADVETRAPESLAEVLGVSPAYARRFKREAGLLVERVGGTVLDVEESGVGEMSALAATTVDEREASLPFPETPLRHARDTWPSSRWAAKSPTAAPVRTLAPATPDPVVPAAHAWTPPVQAKVVSEAGTLLRPGVIEGLDATSCDRLIAQGVRSLEALVENTGLQLAKKIQLPYTRLLELAWLAKRALADRAGAARQSNEPSGAETSRRDVVDAEHADEPDPALRGEGGPSARTAGEPIFILHPTRKSEADSILAPRGTLAAADRARARAPMRDERARDGRGAFAPDREFGPRLTDSEVAGPFA